MTFDGIDIPPLWKIIPPCRSSEGKGDGIRIIINPGAGFGDGTHPTTQLCLQALATFAPRSKPWRMLDFGTGSGILAIGAAKLGAAVEAVEIDEPAIDNARENACLNRVSDQIGFSRTLEGMLEKFDLVVANILCRVLLDFAAPLVTRLALVGTLVLSGLVATDVPQVIVRYTPLLDGRRPEVFQRDEWRAVVWQSRRRLF